ncbi:MAG: hypothetical protein FJ263_03645 [Planctomycetes bacterium]|nr:hypothetical protein [Planctomycetota bacterium]
MNKADSLNCIRHIAESFIAKHAPDEIRYFPIIWNRFCSENLFSQRTSRVSILTFAEQNNIGLISPSMLFVLKGVMFELKTKIDKPSLEKVRNAVRTCAVELGASNDIAVSLEQNLSVMIYENLLNLSVSTDTICNPKFPQNRIVSVNSIKDIRIDGQKIKFEAQQPLALFRELLRKNKVHWSIAFLLFPTWCNSKVNDPKEQFKKLAYKMNMFMQNNGLDIKIDWEKTDDAKAEYVKLSVPDNVRISGGIIESKNLIETAESLMKENRHKDAIDNAIKAFNNDSVWLAPMIVFAEVIAHLDRKQLCDFREHIIKIQGKLKYQYELRVNAAGVAEKYPPEDRQNKYFLFEIMYDYASEINQIVRASKILDTVIENGDIRQTSEELEYDLICSILREMKNLSGDGFNLQYTRLLNTKSVKEVIQNTVVACSKNLSDYEIKNENVLGYLWEYIREIISGSVEYENIGHLKGHWVKALEKRIENDLK